MGRRRETLPAGLQSIPGETAEDRRRRLRYSLPPRTRRLRGWIGFIKENLREIYSVRGWQRAIAERIASYNDGRCDANYLREVLKQLNLYMPDHFTGYMRGWSKRGRWRTCWLVTNYGWSFHEEPA